MANYPLTTQYADELKLFRGQWQRRGLWLLIAVLIAYPVLASQNWMTVANLAMIAIVGSTALMILTGFTGQISLGHAAFLALGAYTAAICGNEFALPFWLVIPISGLVAALFGLMIGPFALRLEGLYLAIVTIGLIFLVNHILLSFPDWTGGVSGTSVPMSLWFGENAEYGMTAFTETLQFAGLEIRFEHKLYAVFLTVTVLTVLAAVNLARSNTGRAMMAVRDHDIAAAVMGVNPAKYKIIAFGLSSFFAGVAGAMYGYQQQFITIDPPFNLLMSVNYIAMIILGGVGTVFGAVAGALAFVFLTPLLEIVGRQIPLLNQLSSGQQSTLLFAFLVIAVLLFEPLGLYGIWLRIKRYFLAWPFSY